MAYVRQIEPGSAEADAEPILRQVYREALDRAGKVWNIVKVTSLGPRVTRASLALYREIMHGPGALPRRVRETLAVVVSRANGCEY